MWNHTISYNITIINLKQCFTEEQAVDNAMMSFAFVTCFKQYTVIVI